MSYLNPCAELNDLGNGQFQHVQHLRPVAYLNGGGYQAVNPNWQDGDETCPHLVTAAPLMISSDPTGGRRLHPTREQDVFLTLGRIWHKPAATWVQAPMNALQRSGNILTSTNTNYDLQVTMLGHGLKFDLIGKNGFWPVGNTIAFPASLTGLDRVGRILYKDGVPVATLRAPVVYDANDPSKTLPIGISFGGFGSQTGVIFTLPTPAQLTTAGITAPVIDPTLEVQPDGATGLDTFVRADAPTTNAGTNAALVIGDDAGGNQRRTLIKFDLSSLPDAAVISAATLSLYATADNASAENTYSVYRLKRAWVEAEATWNIYSTGNNWETAGGFGANDCEQSAIGLRVFSSSETLNAFKDFALTPTTKTALDLGNGWLTKPPGDAGVAGNYNFASSDNATAANRPKLSVTYTLPSAAMTRSPMWGRFH